MKSLLPILFICLLPFIFVWLLFKAESRKQSETDYLKDSQENAARLDKAINEVEKSKGKNKKGE